MSLDSTLHTFPLPLPHSTTPAIKMLLKPPQLSLSRFSCAETDTEIDTNTRRKNETETETETKPDHRAIRNRKKQRETETEKQKAGSDLRNAANGTPDERYLNVEFIGN